MDAGVGLPHTVIVVVHCTTLRGSIYTDHSEPSVEVSIASSLQKFDREGASL